MAIVIQNSNKGKQQGITFPLLHCWNPVTEVITVAAQVEGKRVSCRVAVKDLKTKFHVFNQDPLALAKAFKTEIQNAARSLIDKKSFEPDGSILISYKDL